MGLLTPVSCRGIAQGKSAGHADAFQLLSNFQIHRFHFISALHVFIVHKLIIAYQANTYPRVDLLIDRDAAILLEGQRIQRPFLPVNPEGHFWVIHGIAVLSEGMAEGDNIMAVLSSACAS
jgi:hypothetical protein